MRLRPLLRRFKTDVASWSRLVVISAACTVAVCASAYGAYLRVWPAVARHSYFRLRSVKVRTNSNVAEPAVLASRAGLFEGTSVWEVDVERAETALAAAPWVADVRVSRRFPGQVSVEVYRREPVAATVSDDGPYLIDSEGVIYREEGRLPFADLPYLTGWDASAERSARIARLRRSLAVVEAAASNEVRVSQVHIDVAGVYWVYPEAVQVPVRLGAAPRPDEQLPRLAAVMTALSRGTDAMTELDLEYPDRAVLRVTRGKVDSVISAVAGSGTGRAGSARRG